jgi:endonuclease/exonuclease/phosphatase family metal-dependent hydrolase
MSDHYGLLNYIDIKKTNSGTTVTPQNKPCEVKVLSQNIRVNNANDGVENSLQMRYPRLCQIVSKYNADINCFQECSRDWKPYIDLIFSKWKYYSVFMKTNVGHCNPVYVSKSKFDLLDSGSFKISEAREGIDYGEDRVASWAKVKDKATGKTLLIMNGHVSTVNSYQADSCSRMIEFAKAQNVDEYLLCGDYNFTMNSNPTAYNVMTADAKDMAVAAKTEGTQGVTGGTFHNWGKRTNNIRIDFFFGSPTLVSKEYTVVNDMFNGQYASDHYGIFNKVVIK